MNMYCYVNSYLIRMLSAVRQGAKHFVRTATYGGRHTITLIPGDGIGPEMCAEVKKTIGWLGVPIDFEEVQLSG